NGAVEICSRFVLATQLHEQCTAYPIEMKVISQRRLQRLDELKRACGAVYLAARDRSIERHDGRRLESFEGGVEPFDLRPIRFLGGLRTRVNGSDGRLHLIRTGTAMPQRFLDQHEPFADQLLVPEPAILILE